MGAVQNAKIILLATVAAIAYGILHDQITARLCVEYFTIGHLPLFPTSSPTVLAICWGVAATFGLGALLGVVLALVSQSGGLPAVPIPRLFKSILAPSRRDGNFRVAGRRCGVRAFTPIDHRRAGRFRRTRSARPARPVHGGLVCSRGELRGRSRWGFVSHLANLAGKGLPSRPLACSPQQSRGCASRDLGRDYSTDCLVPLRQVLSSYPESFM